MPKGKRIQITDTTSQHHQNASTHPNQKPLQYFYETNSTNLYLLSLLSSSVQTLFSSHLSTLPVFQIPLTVHPASSTRLSSMSSSQIGNENLINHHCLCSSSSAL
uniref:Uncharacterized protein n=1 Tax=Opuntia streptacantha TaxID=393608 RepID=A0A7C9D5Y9_OPUST